METEKNTGSALKQALEKRCSGQLPSNFTFRIMEQVRLEALKQQKRRERMGFAAVVVSGLALVGIAVYTLVYRLDFRLDDYISRWKLYVSDSPMVAFYCYIALLVLLLLAMDYWLRKHKRRSV